ncbi:hypothetical protein KXD40_000752 [Peronospora effusa]|uniref:Uncharacterized protein n=1 Tax=Peronospora effusa TaxID=542832 RepID=A0A3M6VV28_9STRA|nr:hypothetical protein DD238_001052 [Peronospora effusa]RQM17912.1 hypothetical protein DD237_002231 [Peronospora effusa]UIZ21149.1 hypothetical protein KXD40_000752 [Peronospora effusa]
MMKAIAVLWTVCAGKHYLGKTSEASWRKAFSLSTRQEEKNIKAPTESNVNFKFFSTLPDGSERITTLV